MAVYIALLRGINVGKAKRVAMGDLRSIVADVVGIEAGDVATVLMSGNVVFRAPRKPAPAKLEGGIKDRLGMDVRVFVHTLAEVQKAVDGNPFEAEAGKEPSRLAVAFLESKADRKALQPIVDADWSPERFAIGRTGTILYAWHPNGVTGSKLAEALDKVKGPTQTVRNLATLQKILAKAEALGPPAERQPK